MWKFENLRIFAARFVRFFASTTLVFNVLSHLHYFWSADNSIGLVGTLIPAFVSASR